MISSQNILRKSWVRGQNSGDDGEEPIDENECNCGRCVFDKWSSNIVRKSASETIRGKMISTNEVSIVPGVFLHSAGQASRCSRSPIISHTTSVFPLICLDSEIYKSLCGFHLHSYTCPVCWNNQTLCTVASRTQNNTLEQPAQSWHCRQWWWSDVTVSTFPVSFAKECGNMAQPRNRKQRVFSAHFWVNGTLFTKTFAV